MLCVCPGGTCYQIPGALKAKLGEYLGHGAVILGVERTESHSVRLVRLAGMDREGPGPAQGI